MRFLALVGDPLGRGEGEPVDASISPAVCCLFEKGDELFLWVTSKCKVDDGSPRLSLEWISGC